MCQTLTLPFQPGRTDLVHMRPTPSLRGLSNNLGNLITFKTTDHHHVHETLNRKNNGVYVAEFLRAAEDLLRLFTERNNSYTQLDRTEELEALLVEEQLTLDG